MKNLSQYWMRIQGTLFPWLTEELDSLSEKQQQLITVLEMARIEDFVRGCRVGWVGAPEADRRAIARAFAAKAVYNMTTNASLRDRLLCDKVLRRICGWERKDEVPSESTFSRAFKEFAESALASRVHEALIKKHHSEHLVGHISRDSTAIEAREKVCAEAKRKAKEKVANKKTKSKAKCGRPKHGEERAPKELTRLEKQQSMTLKDMLADLPKGCDIGTKRNSKGHTYSWKGYKLHIDTADGAIPISATLTSASVHDSQAALPLAIITAKRVTSCYDLMDSAYDAEIIRNHSQTLGHVPLIDYNHRGPNDTREFAPHEAERYKERSTAERVNARLKDEFGGRMVRVRGPEKVMTHLMFGLIALTVDQLMRFVT